MNYFHSVKSPIFHLKLGDNAEYTRFIMSFCTISVTSSTLICSIDRNEKIFKKHLILCIRGYIMHSTNNKTNTKGKHTP